MLVLSTLAVSSWIFWNSSFILDNFSNPLRCLLPHPLWFNLWPCSFYSGLLPVAICSWRQIRVREWNNNNKKSSEILKYLHWSCAGNEVYSLAVRSRFCVEDSGALADCEALQSWLQCLCLLLLRIWVLWMHSDNSACSWKKRCNMWPFFGYFSCDFWYGLECIFSAPEVPWILLMNWHFTWQWVCCQIGIVFQRTVWNTELVSVSTVYPSKDLSAFRKHQWNKPHCKAGIIPISQIAGRLINLPRVTQWSVMKIGFYLKMDLSSRASTIRLCFQNNICGSK